MSRERARRISELFTEAAELPPDERRPFLDDACGSDDALKTELRSLLEHHYPVTISDMDIRSLQPRRDDVATRRKLSWMMLATAVAFAGAVFSALDVRLERGLVDQIQRTLELGTPSLSALMAPAIAAVEGLAPVYDTLRSLHGMAWVLGGLFAASLYGLVSTLFVGDSSRRTVHSDRFGPYTLREPIGEGGVARVYRATHVELDRPVAIKLLKSDTLTPDDVARFGREVRLLSQLHHENTVQILDYGCDETGALFYAMELVSGVTVYELVTHAGPLPPSRAIWILRQVAGALEEAHGLGIVHRDIKPTNLMIGERRDRADLVKVLDFGLARAMARLSTRITRHDLLGGTPLYIAPERIRDPDRVDARSDLYALGAVAYYLLTAREVVEGVTPEEVLLKTLDREPKPLTHHVDGVPPALDELVMALLAKKPEERIQTAPEIAEALGRLSTRFPWTQDEARAWWRRFER